MMAVISRIVGRGETLESQLWKDNWYRDRGVGQGRDRVGRGNGVQGMEGKKSFTVNEAVRKRQLSI